MALLKLDPSNHKISDLFDYVSINKFVVPPFQRPYAWTIEHCEALWNDIEQSWNSNYVIPCFLGSIIVYPENENEKQLLLIDGQQRMTTIMLFLRAAYLVIQSTMKVMTNEETFDLRMECRAQIKKLETSLWKPLEPGYDNSEIDKSCPRLERHNI